MPLFRRQSPLLSHPRAPALAGEGAAPKLSAPTRALAVPSEDELAALAGDLVGYFRARLRDPELASDLAQDVMVRVLSQVHQLEQRSAFRGWAFRIAFRCLQDHWRAGGSGARARVALLGEETLSDPRAGPASHAARSEREQRLAEALRALPERQAEVLLLHAVRGFDIADVAKALDLAPGAVRSALHRGRERLRKVLRDDDPGHGESP